MHLIVSITNVKHYDFSISYISILIGRWWSWQNLTSSNIGWKNSIIICYAIVFIFSVNLILKTSCLVSSFRYAARNNQVCQDPLFYQISIKSGFSRWVFYIFRIAFSKSQQLVPLSHVMLFDISPVL